MGMNAPDPVKSEPGADGGKCREGVNSNLIFDQHCSYYYLCVLVKDLQQEHCWEGFYSNLYFHQHWYDYNFVHFIYWVEFCENKVNNKLHNTFLLQIHYRFLIIS